MIPQTVSAFLLVPSMLLAQSSPPLPPAKQAIEHRYTQEREAGTQNPAPRDPNTPYPKVVPGPLESGIFDPCDAPFSSHSISGASCWRGLVNGIETSIYAGSQGQEFDPEQSIIIIDPAEGEGKFISTPVKAGVIHVIRAPKNGQLILVSKDGSHLFIFDVNRQVFTSTIEKPKRGDLNGDGVVNLDDMDILKTALNTEAFGPNDPRDLNHDGKIDIVDARLLTTLCTHSHCS